MNKIEEDIKIENEIEQPISESPIGEDLKKKLGEIGVITVDDLKTDFNTKIKNSKTFSKQDKKDLEPLIKLTN